MFHSKKDIGENIHGPWTMVHLIKSSPKILNGLRNYRRETGINACGIYPIELLLKLLPSEAQGEILNYDTSGHQSNDFSFSVSYASVLFTKPLETKSGHYIPKADTLDNNLSFCLTNKEKALLLSLARNTLETYTKTGAPPKFDQTEYALPPRLKRKIRGVCDIKKHGELRGCIGHIVPRSPLSHAVIENTINSSANDWRFNPVEAKEVPDITIEISVLSQMKKINEPDEFIVGKEGIVIRKGSASAVFLPQVATEQGWDRAETLCQLCRKAGLSPDAWKDDEMEFFVFTANVFHEGEKYPNFHFFKKLSFLNFSFIEALIHLDEQAKKFF